MFLHEVTSFLEASYYFMLLPPLSKETLSKTKIWFVKLRQLKPHYSGVDFIICLLMASMDRRDSHSNQKLFQCTYGSMSIELR